MVDVDARLRVIEARRAGLASVAWDPIPSSAAAHQFLAQDVPWLLAVLKEQADQIERLQREATADAVARSGGES